MVGFLWFELILKIPLVLLILCVWWVLRHQPGEPPSSDDDGGIRRRGERPHPRPPFPNRPRRGPHGDPAPGAPARIRTVQARARTYGH